MTCRMLLGGEEGTLALLEGGGVAWKRDEAIGAIKATLFVDLPAPSAEMEAKQRASSPSLGDRLHTEMLTAKARACLRRHLFGRCALCGCHTCVGLGT